MIPTTLAGLIVFAASLVPGYIWVRVAEVRQPRLQRTPLLELAELIFLGSSFAVVSFSAVFLASAYVGVIERQKLAAGGTDYLLLHPARVIVPLLGALVAAYLSTYWSARFAYRKFPRKIRHGRSSWDDVLEEMPDRFNYVTVDLRDGTSVAGFAYLYTVGEVPYADRELALMRRKDVPLSVKRPEDQDFHPVDDRTMLVQGGDILFVGVKYVPALTSGHKTALGAQTPGNRFEKTAIRRAIRWARHVRRL